MQIRASTRDRPRPLYFCTALNLGLHKARGQPCILDYMLPPASPLPVRNWIRRLLLLPPPPATAASVHRICSTLEGDESLCVLAGRQQYRSTAEPQPASHLAMNEIVPL